MVYAVWYPDNPSADSSGDNKQIDGSPEVMKCPLPKKERDSF